MFLDPLTTNLTFGSVTSTGSATNGITLDTVVGTVALGAVSVTNATASGIRMVGSSATVTASSVSVTGASANAITFGTNTGSSFSVAGTTTLNTTGGNGINANAATGTYAFTGGLAITFTGANRGIDLRGSTVTSFTAGNTTITGDGTAGSIAVDLSGSQFNAPQPVSGTPNIQLGTGAGQAAAISNVATGVKLGEPGNSAHSYLRYGNQTSGSSIAVTAGGFTIDATNLTTTSAFQEGRYEFAGVTYTGQASFEGANTNFIFVGTNAAGSANGGTPSNRISTATFLASDNTTAFLAGKTVVFVNDNVAGINLGASTLNLGASTSLLGFGNGATVVVPGGTIPANVIGTFTPGGGTFTDGAGAATVLSSTSTLTLSTGNTLSNFILGNATTAITGTSFGTLTVNGMVINTNGAALNLSTGTLAGTGFTSITSTGGTNAINLNAIAGTVNFGTGALSGATGATFKVVGGTVAATYSGNITQATAGQALVSISGGHATGTITFQTGTLSATNGTGLQFDNADGTYSFSGTTTLNGGDAGIDIVNGSGGIFTFGAGTSITSPTGVAYREDTSTAFVSYSGTITQNNAASAVVINGKSTSTTTFSGLVTANTSNVTAINLTGNTGGTISFNGGLNIDTNNGTGFVATGGGTINVAATGGDESVTSAIGGIAVNLTGITIGAVSFDSITANGASANSGVILNGTGAGTFTVSGTTAVDLRNLASIKIDGTVNASFGTTNITNRGGIGVDINTHAGALSFGATTISGGGVSAAISDVGSTGGSVTFASTAISGSGGTAITITNNTGTFTSSGGTIISNSTGDAIVVTQGTGNVTIAAGITNSTGRSANITSRTGGTVDISGSISDTGSGINVSSNTGGVINFSNATKTLNTGANQAVTLATNTGATINFTGGGLAITTTTATGFGASGGGTITVQGASNTISSSAGGTALSLSGITIGASGFGLASITANGASANSGVVLNNTGAGTLTVTGTTAVDLRSASSIKIDNTVNATFGTTNVTNRGGIGIDINTHTGTLAFGTTGVSGAGGVTAAISDVGSTGGSVTFDTTTISGSGGTGVSLSNDAGSFTMNNGGTISGSTGDEIVISGGAGTVAIAAAATNVTNSRVANISGRTGGTLTLSGNLSDTGLGILVQNSTGGTITFSGGTKTLTTGGNNAVSLLTNTGATINFTNGGLVITTTSGIGFNATGGGTINVTGTGNTINSVSATALNVVSTTIGASGLTFQRIDAGNNTAAADPSTGILLSGTGSNGLTVTGTGSASSGGVIQNVTVRGARFSNASNISLSFMTFTADGTNQDAASVAGDALNGTNTNAGAGIDLQTVSNVTLTSVSVTDGKQIGINGNNVNGLTMTSVSVLRNGDEVFEDGVQFVNLSGTLTVTNGTYRDNASNQFEVQNGSGSLTVNVNGATFSNTTFPTGATTPSNTTANSGLFLATHNAATMSPTITNSTVDRIYAQGIRLDMAGTSSMIANIGPASGAGNGNTITNSNQAISITGSNTGGLTYNIRNNTTSIDPAVTAGGATNQIGVARSTSAGTWIGVIDHNFIGTAGTANSGSQVAGSDGIDIVNNSAGLHRLSIINNQIHDTEGSGIVIISGGSPDSSTVSWTVQNNTITNPDQNAGAANPAILIQSGTSIGTDTTNTSADISGNTITGTWSLGTGHLSSIRVRSLTAAGGSFALLNFNPATNYSDDATGIPGRAPTVKVILFSNVTCWLLKPVAVQRVMAALPSVLSEVCVSVALPPVADAPPPAKNSGSEGVPVNAGEAANLFADTAFWPGEAFETPGFRERI